METLRALLYLPAGASTFADGIDALHAFVITVTMLMATLAFGAAAWFTVRHRRRRARQLTERLTASLRREIVIIGGILAMFLLWWVIGYRQYLRMMEPPADAEIVYVYAKQWMWTFSYGDGRETNDLLTVPSGRRVKLVMTSRDVIHSFFVPELRVKHDVLPGRWVTVWFEATQPGVYPIWCTEYCGVGHSQMRARLVVLHADDYARWKSQAGGDAGVAVASDLVALGREVALKRACVACHTLDGQRHVGPTFRGLFGSTQTLADGRRVIADEAYLTRSMMEPNADVVAGYRSVMPTYQGTLTNGEVAALVELIRSLRAAPAEREGVALPDLSIDVLDAAPQDPWGPR
ncbi:MAG: cytochrome c oxidase subunit II [Labilithrix sp.]|nr:cytochrome c oxidase subunit II [Labilithrix sp.]